MRSFTFAGLAILAGIAVAAAVPAWRLAHRPASPPEAARVPAAPPVVRLAVLPFHNTSPHPTETDYLRDGFNDELTSRLGALEPRQLRVLARGTTRQYLDSNKPPNVIASESGAHFLLEGSIGFNAGRAQLMAALVNPADQTIIWSRTFSGSAAELDTIEGEIAEAVGSNLDLPQPLGATRTAFSPAGRSPAVRVAPAAYDEYLRGRFELEQKNIDGYRRALGHFQTASTIAPD